MWAAVKIGKEEFWLVSGAKKSDLAYTTLVVKGIKNTVAGLFPGKMIPSIFF